MFTVYSIYNKKHSKIYIGQTVDMELRIDQHRNKIFHNSFTSRYDGRWEIIYTEEYNDRTTALKREKQLKSYRGREFVKKYIPR